MRSRSTEPFVFASSLGAIAYKRAGAPVLFDPCRRILIPATPEEHVRQQFVRYLVAQLKIPLGLIRTELNLAHFATKRGHRGRMDILVLSPNQEPLMLVECKAPTVPVDDDTLDQVLKYCRALNAPQMIVGTTNGLHTHWYRVSAAGVPQRLAHAPGYCDLLKGIVPAELASTEPPQRSEGTRPSAKLLRWMREEGVLGDGSPPEHREYLANIAGLFLLERLAPTLRGRADLFRVRESGFRETSFGNAAGGSWPGRYRYFLIEDSDGEAQLVSFCVLGKMLVKAHPVFGNTNGCTTLIVAVDDFDKRHNSLQLDLDRFVEVSPETMTFWHDGTLTRGKRGAAPRAEVVQFVRKRAPHLVQHGRIALGTLPMRRKATWADAEVLIANLIEYALVRDDFRREGSYQGGR